jgi:nucleoside-diphosphate-sugar epimerase
MAKLILGCGYLGARVARRWLAAGQQVFVVTRDGQRAAALAKEGYRPLVADVLRPASLAHLPQAETVLYAVGYDRGAGASIHDVFVGGLQAVLDALPPGTGKIIYISSTGVYAQSHGEWVDEDSPCQPRRAGGRACLEAEQALAAHRLGARAIVLRMAGLYGPGRIPNAVEIRRHQPLAAPQQGHLNLIHVDDAASVVLAADERATAPRSFVVADGHPVERRIYYEELARLLGAPPPDFTVPPADSPAAARAARDKRVKNSRMAAELGVALAYPSYREGLAAIVQAEAETAAG